MSMAIWDDVIPAEERAIYTKGGMGVGTIEWGRQPAVLVVDMTYGFVDSAFPLGHSETGWPAVHAIRRLLDRARALRVPVFYTKANRPGGAACELGLWKGGGAVAQPAMQDPKANEIVAEIAPQPGDAVISKTWPSGFAGTNLASFLIYNRVDTVIITGMVTSGCVRATALDAFALNYRVIIPQECAADRGQTSHKVALFEIHMKYGDVLPLAEVIAQLEKVRSREKAPAGR
jgi:nicotinamidase-related amidase